MFGKLVGGLLVAAALTSAGSSAVQSTNSTIDISVLSLAGWNGELEPLSVAGAQVGGAAELAARFSHERAVNPNTLLLGTGDSFGTSPPISNLFDDEPVIKAMNAMGFDADGLGNGSFDHGIAYLQRLMTMADYPFIAANLLNTDANLSGVRPFRIFEVAGVKIAVIGVVDPASPRIVFPGNFGTIEVTEPSYAAIRAREAAAAQGAEVFVLITEMGLTSAAGGPLVDLANDVTGFDAVLGISYAGNYATTINGAAVVAGEGRGLAYGRTTLRFDTVSREVVSASGTLVRPVVTGAKAGLAVGMLVETYYEQLAGKLSAVIAQSTVAAGLADVCGRPEGRSCESLTGNVVADALRVTYGADVALVNGGSIRAGITCPAIDAAGDFCPAFAGPPFPITEGQVQAVLPFGNIATTVTVSGAELKAMLENGVSSFVEDSGRFPQVSGICFWYEASRASGSRVATAVRQAADGSCTGAAIEFTAASGYLLATNDFIAAGGDSYPVPAAEATARDRLDFVLSLYLERAGTISPVSQGRITCVGAGCPVIVGGVAATAPSGQIRPPSTGDAGLRQDARRSSK